MKLNRLRSQKGAALVEAAVTIPMILLISVGIFEFGRAYQTWQVLTNAAREGARVACLEGPTDSDIRTRVREYLTNGGLTTLPDGNIVVNRNASMTGTTATASSVTINYPFSFMVLNPVVRLVVPSDTTTGTPITMTAAAVMRNE
jgi:Flp pilus assembly protein TadG